MKKTACGAQQRKEWTAQQCQVKQGKRESEHSDIPDDVLERIAAFTADYLKKELKGKIYTRRFDTQISNRRFIFPGPKRYLYRASMVCFLIRSNRLQTDSSWKSPYFSSENAYFSIFSDHGNSYATVLYSTKKHLDQFCRAVVRILEKDGFNACYKHKYNTRGNWPREKLKIYVSIPCDKKGNVSLE